MSAFPHYSPPETAPFDQDAYAVGYAQGSVSTAIRYLEQGHADWALQELRRALPHLDAAMAPELRSNRS